MTTCSIVEAGKRGIISEPRAVRVLADMPWLFRRSVDVRQRMRKRPVEGKSGVVSLERRWSE